MKKYYGIAYLDNMGNGFIDNPDEPWILDSMELNEAKNEIENLIQEGYSRITLFQYFEDNLPEVITWGYVTEHICETY